MNKTTMARRRPCNGCRMARCRKMDCPRWQEWFLESWEGVNRYLWAEIDARGRTEPEKFYYDQPHMIKSPCETCPCAAWCDTPCSLRLKWWDARMGMLRRRSGCHAKR